MDILPIPPSPSVENYKKRAKDLVKVAKTRDQDALREWGNEWVEALAGLAHAHADSFVYASFDRAMENVKEGILKRMETDSEPEKRLLLKAQFLIARAHGFMDWAGFSKYTVKIVNDRGNSFESAVDAVVGGDLSALQFLLRQSPALIKEQSSRIHQATLLHYIAANGVEDFRQHTPHNVVEIAKCLLDAGAEVDKLADTYAGGSRQTTMNLLVSSAHPAKAGKMVPLVEVLLDFGAAINGLEDDGAPLKTSLSFGYLDAAKKLVARGARIDNVVVAASLGIGELVEGLYKSACRSEAGNALVSASKFGHLEIVQYLLERGVNVASVDGDDMTGLHWAAAHGHVGVVRQLIDWQAPLELKNRWGGSVLSCSVFFARNQPAPKAEYGSVIELLLRAGAEVSLVGYPTGEPTIDRILEQHQ